MAETNLKKNKEGYGYKYTELAEIHNYLENNGMKYIQSIKRIDTDDYIMTKRFIDGKWEEEAIQGCRVVQATLQGIKNPAQEQGSALTYARRYSLLMAFGLATEDDDGASLGKPKVEKQQNTSMTIEEAKNMKVSFGKYKGIALIELVHKDGKYCDWLYENAKDPNVKKALEMILEDANKQSSELIDMPVNEIYEDDNYVDPFYINK